MRMETIDNKPIIPNLAWYGVPTFLGCFPTNFSATVGGNRLLKHRPAYRKMARKIV
jgi:hypothetical protein